MNMTIGRVECVRSDCTCVVEFKEGIKRHGRIYFCHACADDHESGSGWDHVGCTGRNWRTKWSRPAAGSTRRRCQVLFATCAAHPHQLHGTVIQRKAVSFA
ncbi:MAG: hypothetical protein JSR21_07675 [Proteobacteria bacterium]|nr:hypothetical protein [Pseudomonadota bacterium]